MVAFVGMLEKVFAKPTDPGEPPEKSTEMIFKSPKYTLKRLFQDTPSPWSDGSHDLAHQKCEVEPRNLNQQAFKNVIMPLEPYMADATSIKIVDKSSLNQLPTLAHQAFAQVDFDVGSVCVNRRLLTALSIPFAVSRIQLMAVCFLFSQLSVWE